jgi:hypothetical protein
MDRSSHVAVLVPVGPGEREVARLHDLLDSIAAHEPAGSYRVIAIDDNPEPRDLGDGVDVVRTPLWDGGRRPAASHDAMVAGTVEGLRAARGAEFAVKLDTDALVIAPFAEPVRRALDGRGVVGSYDVMSNGDLRDWSWWGPILRRAPLPLHVFRPPAGRRLPRVTWKARPQRRKARRLLREARARGWPLGAHCLGGAYAVSGALLEREDLLDWRPWVGCALSEDVVVGLLSGAAGLPMASAIGPGEPFALQHIGLPAPPEQLLARGHAIVHSLKDSDSGSEDELRAWFRAQRDGKAPAATAATSLPSASAPNPPRGRVR